MNAISVSLSPDGSLNFQSAFWDDFNSAVEKINTQISARIQTTGANREKTTSNVYGYDDGTWKRNACARRKIQKLKHLRPKDQY